MGFRFRKSFKAGPFRVTASKSGLGTSFGVKGFRTGIGADGRRRTTVTVPGGFSYQTTSGRRASRPTSSGAGLGCLVLVLAVPVIAAVGALVSFVSSLSTGAFVGLGVGTLALAGGGLAVRRSMKQAELRRAQELAAAEEERARLHVEDLTARFGAEAAAKISSRELWVGETVEMLRESLGEPEDVAETVLKTKTKHVFKYDRRPGNHRFGLKVTLENGVVVGWQRADD